jgi:hypothetical protein
MQKRLSDYHDTGTGLDSETNAHLTGCSECASFFQYLSNLGPLISEEIETKTKSMRMPAFPVDKTRIEKKAAFPLSFAWGFAILATLAIGIVSGIFFTRAYDAEIVSKNTIEFVDSIFEQPILLDSEYVQSDTGIMDVSFFEDKIIESSLDEPMAELSDLFIE